MKTIELYFQSVDFEKTMNENKIKLAEFASIEELKKNYLNYFDEQNPIDDWEVDDFDSRIKELDKLNVNDNNGIVLAMNILALRMYQVKNMSDETNPLLELLKNAEIPPLTLCAGYCN